MADEIAKVLRDKELALRLSQALRKKIAEKFNHRLKAKELVRCLEKLA